MIEVFKALPITEASRPLMSAADKCDFAKCGYTEREYLFYGTANVYGQGVAGIEVLASGPYVNRFMVRFPSDASKASGNVVIEILNASTFMDIDRMWILSKDYLMRNGDVYIGVSSKPATVATLKKFDSNRYREIAWPNPRESQLPPGLLGNMGGDSSPATENGLFWDMLTDLADALRSGSVPLEGIVPKRLYLTGWSQSGSYMTRYVNDLIPMIQAKRAQPVFDGYLAAGTGYIVVPGLNQSESPAYIFSGDIKIKEARQPFIAVQTESENARLGGYEAQQEDSDAAELLYRRYEIPGSTHDSYYNMTEYYLGSDDMWRTGVMLKSPGLDPYPNNYPYEYVFHAVWAHLHRWVEKGVPAPKVERIAVNADHYTNECDSYGNAKGGWRQPAIDLPVCTYHPISRPLRSDFTMDCYLYGYREMFPVDRLRKMYGTLEAYRGKVRERSDELVKEGLLLAEDVESCVARTTTTAAEAGLD